MKKLTFTLLAAALLAALPTRAHAMFTFTLNQTGNNVTITGSGSLNTTGLNFSGTYNGNGIRTGRATLVFGAAGEGAGYDGFTGPTSFGTNNNATVPTSATGSFVGINGTSLLFLPTGYVSGSALSNSATFANQTFATLGFTPGTYTYALPSGDSLVITGAASVVPEPSTWATVGAGVAGLGVVALRRRARLA